MPGNHRQEFMGSSATEHSDRRTGTRLYVEVSPATEQLERELLEEASPFTIIEVTPGITVTRMVSQGDVIDAASALLSIGVGIGVGIPINLFCSWLYDRLRRHPTVTLRIDGHEVEVSQEAIAKAIATILTDAPAADPTEPRPLLICPACGYELSREIGHCEVCGLTSFPAE